MIIGAVATMSAVAPPDPTPPAAGFYYLPAFPTMGNSVFFTDTSTNNPTAWQWFCNGVLFSNQQNPSFYFSFPGQYFIKLTASNFFGSSDVTYPVEVETGL